MGFTRQTIGIGRADLTRDCLQQLRLWPGCETVEGLGVLGNSRGEFSVHVIDYGAAKKKLADRVRAPGDCRSRASVHSAGKAAALSFESGLRLREPTPAGCVALFLALQRGIPAAVMRV